MSSGSGNKVVKPDNFKLRITEVTSSSSETCTNKKNVCCKVNNNLGNCCSQKRQQPAQNGNFLSKKNSLYNINYQQDRVCFCASKAKIGNLIAQTKTNTNNECKRVSVQNDIYKKNLNCKPHISSDAFSETSAQCGRCGGKKKLKQHGFSPYWMVETLNLMNNLIEEKRKARSKKCAGDRSCSSTVAIQATKQTVQVKEDCEYDDRKLNENIMTKKEQSIKYSLIEACTSNCTVSTQTLESIVAVTDVTKPHLVKILTDIQLYAKNIQNYFQSMNETMKQNNYTDLDQKTEQEQIEQKLHQQLQLQLEQQQQELLEYPPQNEFNFSGQTELKPSPEDPLPLQDQLQLPDKSHRQHDKSVKKKPEQLQKSLRRQQQLEKSQLDQSQRQQNQDLEQSRKEQLEQSRQGRKLLTQSQQLEQSRQSQKQLQQQQDMDESLKEEEDYQDQSSQDEQEQIEPQKQDQTRMQQKNKTRRRFNTPVPEVSYIPSDDFPVSEEANTYPDQSLPSEELSINPFDDDGTEVDISSLEDVPIASTPRSSEIRFNSNDDETQMFSLPVRIESKRRLSQLDTMDQLGLQKPVEDVDLDETVYTYASPPVRPLVQRRLSSGPSAITNESTALENVREQVNETVDAIQEKIEELRQNVLMDLAENRYQLDKNQEKNRK